MENLYSISEAARRAGKSRNTILKYHRTGVLRAHVNALGQTLFDQAELDRVFKGAGRGLADADPAAALPTAPAPAGRRGRSSAWPAWGWMCAIFGAGVVVGFGGAFLGCMFALFH